MIALLLIVMLCGFMFFAALYFLAVVYFTIRTLERLSEAATRVVAAADAVSPFMIRMAEALEVSNQLQVQGAINMAQALRPNAATETDTFGGNWGS